MEIKRTFNGEEVKIALSEQELNEAYREQKRILDITEIRDGLMNWEPETILNCCLFPYPSYMYFRDEKIEDVVEKILEKEELMLDIYVMFKKYMESSCDDYDTNLYDACKVVLEQFGKDYPDFLESYETIDVIAYKKYQWDWIKRQISSKELFQTIQEYTEIKINNYPNSKYTFNQYLDDFGFRGDSYVCANEFRDAEYQDAVYMNMLLPEDEYNQYLADVSEFVWYDIVSIHGKIFAEKFPISGKMDGEHYQIDAFLDAVSKKYGIETDEVKTYMMDNIDFNPEELPFGAEACGCYKNGELQYL